MSEQNTVPLPLKSVLLNLILKALFLSFVVSLPIVSIPSYLFLENKITSDVEQLETFSYRITNEHLQQGWKEASLNKLYQKLQTELPDTEFYLQKAADFRQKDTSLPTNIQKFKPLIEHVERYESSVINASLLQGTIKAGFPIRFTKECISCHRDEFKSGKAYTGSVGAILVLEAPISINHIATDNVLIFFVIYFLLLVLLTVIIAANLIQKRLQPGFNAFNNKINHLKINSYDRQLDWTRSPQKILEMDELDASMLNHIESIHQLYRKLDHNHNQHKPDDVLSDALFHQEIQHEMVRCKRYEHSFSILLVRPIDLKVLNASAKVMEQESPGSKCLIFGNVLKNCTRDPDLIFRLEDHLFAIISPETSMESARYLKKVLFQRIQQSKIPNELYGNSMPPEYQFTIQLGFTTYDGSEQLETTRLVERAISSLEESCEVTGVFPSSKKETPLYDD